VVARAVVLPLVLLTATAGCRTESPAAPPAARKDATPAAAPREVKVVEATRETVARTVVATGTLAAEDRVVLGFKVAGRVSELTVDLGSRVRRDQPVARLDATDFRLRVAQAEAALQQVRARLGLQAGAQDDRVDPEETAVVRQARALLDEARLTRDRMEKLWDQQFIARAQLDAAVSALQVAEGRYQDAIEDVRNRQALLLQRRSELAIARQQLADTVLTTPNDGAVSVRHASVGQYLEEGAPVVTVVKIHPLRLRLAVPEREAAGVRAGQRVRVSAEGDPRTWEGRVVRMSPTIQEENRTLLVEAEIPNSDGTLRPGAFARAEIIGDAVEPVVVVPAGSLVTFAGIDKVLAVQDGKVVEKRVQTGRRDGARVQITGGLAGGERVVLEPGNLTGGQPVTVVP
jgi:RND family efflux transporter MFP subunit